MTRRKGSDAALHGLPSQGGLLRLVRAFAAALVVVSALSLFYVGHIASGEADAQAAVTERQFFNNAIRDRQALMARDLLVVARWDDSVQGIALELDAEFVTDDFVGTLWWDAGHGRSFIIDPKGRVIASAREEKVDFTTRELPPDDDLAIVARRTVEAHMRYRIPVDAGFSQKAMKSHEIGNIAVFALATVDGGPALVSATAIVPDNEEVLLPDGPPPVAIVARPIDAELLRDLNGQLEFDNLAFSEKLDGKVVVASAAGRPLGSFDWTEARPGSQIWEVVVPVALGLSGFLALAGLTVLRHVRRLSDALAESQERVRDLALHDPLSGLPNRLNFDRQLAAAVEGLRATPFAAIACDLDRFKAVNDTHGHAAGDRVIRAVAERLSEAVGDCGVVGRIGGDEFVVLVTGFADRHRLMLLASRVMASVCAPVTLDGGAVVDVGISLGIAIAPDCGDTANAVMAAADQALYASKAGGRGRALFHADIAGDGASDGAAA